MQLIKPQDLFVITTNEYVDEVLKELPELAKENILIEPEARNTAPSIAYVIKFLIEKKDVSKDEILFVCPSDHIIEPEEKFVPYLLEGQKRAKEGSIVTFGIAPNRPETGYGYIKAEGQKAEKFVEKPDLQTAQEYVLSGTYFWNSGMFVFSLRKMLEEFNAFCPPIGKALCENFETFCMHFDSLPNISIDYAVMEKTTDMVLVPLHLTWSDVGSWDNVYDLFEKDENSNAIVGNVMAIETSNSLIMAQKRLVSTIGVSDLLIIETEDALLVAKKKVGQKVKDMVDKLAEGKWQKTI